MTNTSFGATVRPGPVILYQGRANNHQPVELNSVLITFLLALKRINEHTGAGTCIASWKEPPLSLMQYMGLA